MRIGNKDIKFSLFGLPKGDDKDYTFSFYPVFMVEYDADYKVGAAVLWLFFWGVNITWTNHN